MSPETQKSLTEHTEEAIALVTDTETNESLATVHRFPVERVSAPAQPEATTPFPSDAELAKKEAAEASTGERNRNVGVTVAAIAGAALVALGFAPRGNDTPPPQPETFSDKVENSAQQPYDPSSDELLIDGIRVKPANSSKNSPSEAVLSHPEVATFVAENPDESSSITTSAMTLPTNASGEYVVVGRDIDSDGDSDAIAVPKN